jgi:site-specific DNA-methyltransferase (adenine-specific)
MLPSFWGLFSLLAPPGHKGSRILDPLAVGFTPVGHFVWVKRYASKTGFTQARHEQAYLLAKGHPEKPSNPPADVHQDWCYTGNHLHPIQKLVEALLPLIEAYSRSGDVVLDPFARSGTTVVAAQQLGRRPVGIELDWSYCCVGSERLMERER